MAGGERYKAIDFEFVAEHSPPGVDELLPNSPIIQKTFASYANSDLQVIDADPYILDDILPLSDEDILEPRDLHPGTSLDAHLREDTPDCYCEESTPDKACLGCRDWATPLTPFEQNLGLSRNNGIISGISIIDIH